jgi:hypothetical protein
VKYHGKEDFIQSNAQPILGEENSNAGSTISSL